MSPESVMELMQQETDGLTIITQGGDEMLYGRKGEEIHRLKPFSVEVRSTLGAGDTFKAGCVYGVLHGMKDDDLVRFASTRSAPLPNGRTSRPSAPTGAVAARSFICG